MSDHGFDKEQREHLLTKVISYQNEHYGPLPTFLSETGEEEIYQALSTALSYSREASTAHDIEPETHVSKLLMCAFYEEQALIKRAIKHIGWGEENEAAQK